MYVPWDLDAPWYMRIGVSKDATGKPKGGKKEGPFTSEQLIVKVLNTTLDVKNTFIRHDAKTAKFSATAKTYKSLEKLISNLWRCEKALRIRERDRAIAKAREEQIADDDDDYSEVIEEPEVTLTEEQIAKRAELDSDDGAGVGVLKKKIPVLATMQCADRRKAQGNKKGKEEEEEQEEVEGEEEDDDDADDFDEGGGWGFHDVIVLQGFKEETKLNGRIGIIQGYVHT